MFYVAAAREPFTSANYLAEVVTKGVDIPYDYLRDVLRGGGVPMKTALPVATRRLFPFRNELLSWGYRTIVARCREHNIVPVLIFLPQVEKGGRKEETPDILRIAKEAGFIVWDLSDFYNSRE